jgi:tetratricopeptide (TPR) repeat protein
MRQTFSPGKRRLILTALALLGSASLARAAAPPPPAPELTPRAIYQQTLRATAWLAVPTSKTTWDIGTACVADRSRKLLITSFHVVRDRETVLLLFPAHDGKRLITERAFYMNRLEKGDCIRGKLLDVDPKRDLALIEAELLPAGTTELKLAAATPLPGDRLHAVGNPGESMGQWLYTTGTVRQVYRTREKIDGADRDARVIAAQLPISTGDSGAPVVNDEGALVGVAMSYTRQSPSLGLCVSAEEVRTLLQGLSPRTAEDLNRRGERAFQAGLWARAAADFTSALRLDAKRALFYRNRALAFQRQGKSSQALADLTRAIDLAPREGNLYNDRGLAYLNDGKLARALADFDAALRLSPKNALAYNNRGYARFRKGDHAEAVADYSAALELGLQNEITYHNRGLAYLANGDPEKAIADFTEAIRRRPLFAAAYFNRGRAHAANKAPARAKADHDRALELDPGLARK